MLRREISNVDFNQKSNIWMYWSFIHRILKNKLRLLNCSPSELLQAITDMKEFIVCVWTLRQVLVCWKRHLWLVCFRNIPSFSHNHASTPSHLFCKTSSVLPDFDIQQPSSLTEHITDLDTNIYWEHFFNLIYKECFF